jgi:UDPglucose 6-dehydrogenase
MNVIYVGAGFVGACSAAVAADSGHQVLAFDVDSERVARLSSLDKERIESCLHEKGLAELIIKHQARLTFSTDVQILAERLEKAEAVFMCLPTPERADGSSDLSYFVKGTEMLGKLLALRNNGAQTQRVLIVNKSTVPIDAIDISRQILAPMGVKNFGIASNPEFLVEGKAVYDSVHPERVLVGAECAEDFATMRQLYQRFVDSSTVQYLEMNPYEAAAAKLLSNAALFARLAFTFSTVGRLCEVFPNLNYENVRRGIIGDSRIGRWGFYDSLFAGGSCLIKDAESLSWQMEKHGANANFMRSVLEANRSQLERFYARAKEEAGFSFREKRVAVLGLSFKQDTNDMRHSGAIGIIERLLADDVGEIRAFDPAAHELAGVIFPADKGKNARITYHDSAEAAIASSEALFICTDWPQFRTLGEYIAENCSAPYLIMDGRRMIEGQYAKLAEKGIVVIAVGSPLMGADSKA